MDDHPPRFVVQEHQTRKGTHWDLMLRMGDKLWTWRMELSPAEVGSSLLPLVKIADHPLRFLTYQGPVQNNTGVVRIADQGGFDVLEQTPDTLTVSLHGLHLKGRFALRKTNAENRWTLSVNYRPTSIVNRSASGGDFAFFRFTSQIFVRIVPCSLSPMS
jgi:hypothetical protein